MPDRTCSTSGCQRPPRSPGAKQCERCYSRDYHRRKNPILPTICGQCGAVFTPDRHGKKYCSKACCIRHRKIDEARQLRERNAAKRVTECLWCAVDITARPARAKFCSATCCSAWRRANKQDVIRAQRKVAYDADPAAARERSRRYRAENPERRLQTAITYRVRNLDKVRTSAKRSRKVADPDGMKNRLRFQNRRARLLGNPGSVGVSPQDWYRMVRIYGHCCAYCGERTAKLTLDHVIPVARGGRHAIGNAVPACQTCNSSKSDKFLAVWRYKYLPLRRAAAEAA